MPNASGLPHEAAVTVYRVKTYREWVEKYGEELSSGCYNHRLLGAKQRAER